MFYRNKLIGPILEAISWKEIFLFIVLMGMISGVRDFSLFWFGEVAALSFFLGTDDLKEMIVHYVPIFLTPVALIIVFGRGKRSYLIGLLPSLFSILLLAVETYGSIQHLEIAAYSLAISQRIALLFFIFVGHVRSFSFFAGVLCAFALAPPLQAISFVLLVVGGRFLYLSFTQNYAIFKDVSKRKVLWLAGKSFVFWSPLLLLSIPHFWVARQLSEFGKEVLYANTFIEQHEVYSGLSLEDLLRKFPVDNDQATRGILEAQGMSLEGAPQMHAAIRNSLILLAERMKEKWAYKDYRAPAQVFANTYSLFLNTDHMDYRQEAVLEAVKPDILKLGMRQKFWGENDIALDVQLSIYNELFKNQQLAKSELNKQELALAGQVSDYQAQIDQTVYDIKTQIDRLTNDAKCTTRDQQAMLAQKLTETRVQLATQVDNRLDAISAGMKTDIDQIPALALETYDQMAPPKLTDISKGFEPEDCGVLSVSCHAANLIKSLLRTTYAHQRNVVRGVVKKRSENARDAAHKRLEESLAQVSYAAKDMIKTSTDQVLNISQAAQNESFEMFDRANREAKEATEEGVSKVSAQVNEINALAAEINATMQEEIDRAADEINQRTQHTVMAAQGYLLFIDVSAWFAFAGVVVLSYLYVFSRVAFSRESGLFVTLREVPEKPHENGEIILHGSVFTIPHDHTEVYFVSRRFEPTGRAPKIAIPQWLTSVMARIVTQCYWMNEIAVKKQQRDSVDFRSVAGAEFVEWRLKNGEEVIFNYEDLVAITETVTLSTIISLRFTTMLMGKPLFTVARGPGTLVLETKGVPIAHDEELLVRSVSSSRVIAWQKHTRFTVDSELNIFDIYLSNLYLRRESDDLILIDADPARSKSKVGLIKFALKFIFPI